MIFIGEIVTYLTKLNFITNLLQLNISSAIYASEG